MDHGGHWTWVWKLITLGALFIVVTMLTSWVYRAGRDSVAQSRYDVGFSSHRNDVARAKEVVLNVLGTCRQDIRMATYDFTDQDIATAVIAKKGVISVVSDAKGANRVESQVGRLKEAGVRIRLNSRYAIHHHKFIICDGKIVQTGSFNYTKSAGIRNAENVLVLWDAPEVFKTYRREWQGLWDESE